MCRIPEIGKRIKRRPKNPDVIISPEIMSIFKKKKGVYAVAKRKNLQATNLYKRIRSCDDALLRINKVLWIVDHDLKI